MDVSKRKSLAKEKGACFKCLRQGHLVRNCRNKLRCQKEQCQGSHHTLLHRDQENKDNDDQEDQEQRVTNVTTNENKEIKRAVALPIKRVAVCCENGQRVPVNCLEDPGSQVTLVTERLVDTLAIVKTKGNLALSGIGNQNLKLQNEVTLEVCPEESEHYYSIQAHVISKISNHVPSFDVDEVKKKYPHLHDVDVNLEIGSVDLLIGQDTPALLRQLEARYGEDDEPYAVRTPLGWSICGPINKQSTQDRSSHFISTMHEPYQNTNINLRQFWEIERIPDYDIPPISEKDREILEEIKRSTIQVENRYQVKLPWKKTTSKIPQSYDMALRRLESIERKLEKSPILKEHYHKAIEAYIKDGYVTKVDERPKDTGWYLPHHPVISDYKNTKLRVVFDSAAKVQGISLNDLLEKGPNLLNDLTGILLRFRRFAVGIAGDISKMFLRILLHPDDCKFHRFLWRGNDTEDPTVYQFNCVTFGDRSSPFLASYVIKRVTQVYGEEKPEATEALDKDLYMDDLIRSCKTTQEAKTTVHDVCQILDNGGLNMRNWISNRPSTLDEIPDRVAPHSLEFGEKDQRVLGMNWNPQTDRISFDPQIKDVVWTKRGVLRQLAKLFDPLGLLAAFLVKGKILMQELWRRGKEWDDLLEADLKNSWQAWFNQFADLRKISVPRHILAEINEGSMELHVFSDASEKAMAAVAYVRCSTEDGIKNFLLMCKTQVAPLKMVSIPRLELQACLMGAKLSKFIEIQMALERIKTTLWSDSAVALSWIRSESRSLKSFVANRVAAIQELTDNDQWHHIDGKDNPADWASRGVSTQDLLKPDNIWFMGPAILKEEEIEFPVPEVGPDVNAVNKEKKKLQLNFHAENHEGF